MLSKLIFTSVLVLALNVYAVAFVLPSKSVKTQRSIASSLPSTYSFIKTLRAESDSSTEGVVELLEDDAPPVVEKTTAAPFLSQGDISEEALNPDLSDPKQTRVIIYIILSLIPVLFLIPLMLGSRDLIPLDALPPVELN